MNLSARLLSIFALAGTLRADVHVVDPSGAGDFLSIFAAMGSTVDGDTILVRSGTYDSILVNDLSVDVVADEGALVVIEGYTAVANLSAGREVLLSGLKLVPDDTAAIDIGFLAQNCQGAVRLSGCEILAAPSYNEDSFGSPGAYVANCSDVAFFDCSLTGGMGGPPYWCSWSKGGAGLQTMFSTVALHGCSVKGGDPGDYHTNWDLGGDGAFGVWVRMSSTLRAFGCTVEGGPGGGGDSSFTFCPCGDGGTALHVESSAKAEILGCTLLGGKPGIDQFGPNCNFGAQKAGPITDLVGAWRSLQVPRVVRAGEDVTGTVSGEPGDVVFVAASPYPGHAFSAALVGVWHTAAPHMQTFSSVGTIGGNGKLDLTWSIGDSTLVGDWHLYLQPIVSAAGGRRLASPSVVVIVPAGI